MRVQGVGVRPGTAEGPVVLSPQASVPSLGGSPGIAAFGEIDARDPRLVAGPGWLGFTVSPRWSPDHPHLPGGPPLVAAIDLDLLREGEVIRIDGRDGSLDLPDVTEVKVVTSFLVRPDGRVLLMRRSDRVGSFRGHWAAVSGFLEDPTPEAQARREIQEETGIDPATVELASTGPPVYARDAATIFTIHPFRFRVPEVRVTLDWEHTEYEWVEPSEIRRRPTVPKLDRVWEAVAPAHP